MKRTLPWLAKLDGIFTVGSAKGAVLDFGPFWVDELALTTALWRLDGKVGDTPGGTGRDPAAEACREDPPNMNKLKAATRATKQAGRRKRLRIYLRRNKALYRPIQTMSTKCQ